MADAAARREARKRRILENAEYRLQRITGGWLSDAAEPSENEAQVNHVEFSAERCNKINATETQATTSSSATSNGIVANEPLIGRQTVDSLINEMNADIANDETHSSPYADMFGDIFTALSKASEREREHFYEPHRRSTARAVSNENGNIATSAKLCTSKNVGFNSERQDAMPGSQIDAHRDNSISDANAEQSTFVALLSNRLVYAILAVLVNIAVVFKMEHLFGTSIVVPFFVVMISRLCVCNIREESRGSNMLVAALILSNVRPDFVKAIHRLKGALSFLGAIVQDFAVYVFTFVVVYTTIYRYWNDLDDILPFANEPKVIINDNASM